MEIHNLVVLKAQINQKNIESLKAISLDLNDTKMPF